MQHQDAPQSAPVVASPLTSAAMLIDHATAPAELSTTAAAPATIELLDADDAMDVSVAEASDSINVVAIVDGIPEAATDAMKDDEAMDVEADEGKDEDVDEDVDDDGDADDDDSDSDYDLDQDLETFDEEDDNDDIGADERVHYFASLRQEIDEYCEEELVVNMVAARSRLTGDDAAWVDAFLEAQAKWKEQNGKSADDYSNIVKLGKFIPKTVPPARPVRAVRK